MLNGKEIAEKGWITALLPQNITQHGIDLRIIKVEASLGNGKIPCEGKTILPNYVELNPDKNGIWNLAPGDYQITFAEGCQIPSDHMMKIVQRSSLRRCGAIINSPLFDAGFHTENMGTFMQVVNPLSIEKYARVAQCYFHKATPVENLYDGQFQNDKQRA